MSREYPCVHWVDGICKLHSGREITSWCVEAPCADQKPSNADRIRSMTDEELVLLLIDGCRGGSCEGEAENEYGSINCIACRMKWLQQPAEDL